MQKLISASQLQQALVARRKKLRLSQADVALKLSLSQSRYSQVEADPARLGFDRLLLLTVALGLELHIGIKDEQPQAPGSMSARGPKW